MMTTGTAYKMHRKCTVIQPQSDRTSDKTRARAYIVVIDCKSQEVDDVRMTQCG
jgi:hypothetical protein